MTPNPMASASRAPLLVVATLLSTSAAAQQCEYPISNLSACASRTPRAGHTPSVNGCGPEWFPEGVKVPQGTGEATYAPACDAHDVCYETCNASKRDCDEAFARRMRESCLETYPLTQGSEGDWAQRATCLSRARAYANAVRTMGASAFEDAQKVACECCPAQPAPDSTSTTPDRDRAEPDHDRN